MDYSFPQKLSDILNSPDGCLIGNAAVVALLRERNEYFELFFVKRTETPKDPWSGQTAFPGGKRCPEDNDLKDTVIRETFEETGLNLRKGCRFLGTLDPIRSIQRPQVLIVPFIALLLEEQKIKLNHELTKFFWTPLAELTQTNGTRKYQSKDYPAFVIENNVVWGITYQITTQLVSVFRPFMH